MKEELREVERERRKALENEEVYICPCIVLLYTVK